MPVNPTTAHDNAPLSSPDLVQSTDSHSPETFLVLMRAAPEPLKQLIIRLLRAITSNDLPALIAIRDESPNDRAKAIVQEFIDDLGGAE